MTKKLEEIQNRHMLIKNLIASQDIPNQSKLQKLLKQNGIKVTQATLSRDLNELGILRVPTAEGFAYRLGQSGDEPALKYHLAEEIISVLSNESTIVIKTYPGRAQGVALFVDKKNSPAILGTIAGDDTILVVPASVKKIKNTVEELKTILGIK